jgi:glycerophosphoryl diester phosphodiesterase
MTTVFAHRGFTDGFVENTLEAVAEAKRQGADGVLAIAAEGWYAIHPFVTDVNPALVERAQGAGLAVNVWTVYGRHELTALVELGIDGVITDDLVAALSIAHADHPAP